MARDSLLDCVAVLGAGVMGSQIAALLANAGVPVDLLDLPAGGEPAGLARAGIAGLSRLRPAALYLPELSEGIRPGSLEDPSAAIGRASWVIEAVVEDLSAKRSLLARIEPFLRADAVVSTNTSGLSIAALAAGLGPDGARRFLGVHFFNPPRHMKLVEVIRGPTTEPSVVEEVTAALQDRLGKGVVECRDTPNFVANRLGVFALMDALHRMEADGLSPEEVDAVTGPLLGRPRSATLRLCDLIGLDTLLHVAGTAHRGLPGDPFRQTFAPPARVAAMVEAGRLGDKTGGGFYRRSPSGIETLDPGTLEYRPLRTPEAPLPSRGSLGERLSALFAGGAAAGGLRLLHFGRLHLAATLGYCAHCAPEVADALEDVDRALRWGFNWEAGPFELIDLVGADRLRRALDEAGLPAPPLLERIAAADPARVYTEGSGPAQVLTPAGTGRRARKSGGPPDDAALLAGGEVILESAGARLVDVGQGAGVIEFRGKLNVLGPESLALARQAVGEEAFEAIVLTGAGEHFSAGADLKYVLALIDEGAWQRLEEYLRLFQEATAAMRHASVPVVAAARGLALGGGCEMCLSAAARVAAGELRMGLVETRVGLVPGAGGCKEMVRRFGAAIDGCFLTLREGRMSDNALEARQWGFLDEADDVRLAADRLLVVAIERARALADGGWQPPEPTWLPVAGVAGLARLHEQLERGRQEGGLTSHDDAVGRALARVLCGGGEGELVSEERLLELEREAFLELCGTAATRARIAHMLETGKPLRN